MVDIPIHHQISRNLQYLQPTPLRSPALFGASNGLNAQSQGGHVQQQQILSALAAQDSGLHGRTIGDSFIRVDAAVGLLTCNWLFCSKGRKSKKMWTYYIYIWRVYIYNYIYICVYVKNI